MKDIIFLQNFLLTNLPAYPSHVSRILARRVSIIPPPSAVSQCFMIQPPGSVTL